MSDSTDPDSSNQPPNQPLSDPTPPSNPTPSPGVESSAPTAGSSNPRVDGLFFPAMGNGSLTQKDEKLWASLGHLLSLSGIPTGTLGYVVGPLIPYLLKKGESPYVDEHSKETLNFSILTFLIIWISSIGIIPLGCFGVIIPGIMAILNLVFCIQGALAAKSGEAYRYPFNWRIIK